MLTWIIGAGIAAAVSALVMASLISWLTERAYRPSLFALGGVLGAGYVSAVALWEMPVPYWMLTFFLVLIGAVDARTHEIHDLAVGACALCMVGISWAVGNGWVHMALGAVAGAGLYGTIYVVAHLVYKREAFGQGDVLFLGAVGIFLGPIFTLFAGLLTFYVALLGIVIYKIIGRVRHVKQEVAFAPFIGIAVYLTAAFGEAILRWYLG